MMNLARSMMHQSLNASAYGLRQMVRLMEVYPSDQPDQNSVSASCKRFFGSVGNTMTSLMTLGENREGWAAYRAFGTLDQCSDWIGGIVPSGTSRVVWWEGKNKLKAFCLFQYVDSILEIPPKGNFSLADFAVRARERGPFFSPWAWEGLGRNYTLRNMGRNGRPRGLLFTGSAEELPADCLAPLHVGMGVALAEHLLAQLETGASQERLRQVTRQFLSLCQENARAPYLKAALEPLGLIAYNLHPHLIQPIAEQLAAVDPEFEPLFWHGVGRGSYFEAKNLVPLPDSPWRSFETCLRLTTNKSARNNALAGLIWALTLVNLEKPEVLASFLDRHLERLGQEPAFVNGVTSAIQLWRDCASSDPVLERFLQYGPNDGKAPPWQAMVIRPCRQALTEYHQLQQENRLCDIFQYRASPEEPHVF